MNVLMSPLGIFVLLGAAALIYYFIDIGRSLLTMWDVRRERKEWERDVRRNRH